MRWCNDWWKLVTLNTHTIWDCLVTGGSSSGWIKFNYICICWDQAYLSSCIPPASAAQKNETRQVPELNTRSEGFCLLLNVGNNFYVDQKSLWYFRTEDDSGWVFISKLTITCDSKVLDKNISEHVWCLLLPVGSDIRAKYPFSYSMPWLEWRRAKRCYWYKNSWRAY